MIHHILRFLFKIIFWIYYRRIVFKGLENVPTTVPVILACNHPNSFLDAIVVGLFQKRRIHFLARSDVFNTPFKNWILSQLSLLPVYRLQEGLENLDKNKDTFSKCYELFDNGGMVLIFSEGLCIQEMRLRPLKKGTARIALEYSKNGKPLMVVPVGLNYFNPMKAREDLTIGASPGLDAASFAEEYASNSARAINSLTKQLEEGLKNVVIDNRDRDNDAAIGQLVEIEKNNGRELDDLVKVVQKVNDLSQADRPMYDRLVEMLNRYRQGLDEYSVDDRTMKDTGRFSLTLLLLVPVFYFGVFVNGLPLITARYLARTVVRKKEFYDSVLTGAFMFLNIFHHLFIFVILLFIHPFLAVLIPGILLVAGGISTSLHDSLKRNRLRAIRGRIPKEVEASIRNLRSEIAGLIRVNP